MGSYGFSSAVLLYGLAGQFLSGGMPEDASRVEGALCGKGQSGEEYRSGCLGELLEAQGLFRAEGRSAPGR